MKRVSILFVCVIYVLGMVACDGYVIDFSPYDEDVRETTRSTIEGEVYWTAFGEQYHLPTNEVDKYGEEVFCENISEASTIYIGTLETAKEEGKRLCSLCAKREGLAEEEEAEE